MKIVNKRQIKRGILIVLMSIASTSFAAELPKITTLRVQVDNIPSVRLVSGGEDVLGSLMQNLKNYLAEIVQNERALQAMNAPSAVMSGYVPYQAQPVENAAAAIMDLVLPFYIVETDKNIADSTSDKPFGIEVQGLNRNHPFRKLWDLDPYKLHIAYFCSEAEQKKGLCKITSGYGQNQDLDASSLFAKNALPTNKEQMAAFAFYRHLYPYMIVKLPVQLKEKGKDLSSSVGKIKTQWAGIARQSLSQYTFEDLLKDRIPVEIKRPRPRSNPTSEQQLQYQRELKAYNDLKAYYQLPEEAERTGRGPFQANTGNYIIRVSPKQIAEYQVFSRYDNQAWQQKVSDASSAALLRELVLMKSFELKMQYEANEKLDSIRSLLSLMSSSVASSQAMADQMKKTLGRTRTLTEGAARAGSPSE